jgi:hypothetical protein
MAASGGRAKLEPRPGGGVIAHAEFTSAAHPDAKSSVPLKRPR